MIAGLLMKLGIYMGEELNKGTNEDRKFVAHAGMRNIFTDARRNADKQAYLNAIRAVVKDRNAGHAVWGWKDPIAILYIAEIEPLLRAPHYVVVTRDPGAVAQREMVAEPVDRGAAHVLVHLHDAAVSYARIASFLAPRNVPTLLISYERAMRRPRELARSLSDFLGVNRDGFEEWAASYVQPTPATYDSMVG